MILELIGFFVLVILGIYAILVSIYLTIIVLGFDNTNKDTNFLNLEYEYNDKIPKTENNEFLEEDEKVLYTIGFELTNEQLKRRLKEE